MQPSANLPKVGATIEALAQLGRLIPKAQERGELRDRGRHPKTSTTEELKTMGIDHKTSSLAQKLASLPPEQLEQ